MHGVNRWPGHVDNPYRRPRVPRLKISIWQVVNPRLCSSGGACCHAINWGQTVQTSYAAMVLDVTIDEDTNNNIIAGYGNYIPHLGQATLRDTGVAGSSATALEPGSGVTDTGGTSITIDGIVYTSFGRIEQVNVITVDGTITGHIWLRPIPMATLRPRRYFCQMRAQQTKPIFPT